MWDVEQVYIEYMPQVYKYLFSLCQKDDLAEELTQEVFCQALKCIDSFREECSLFVWLCQIGKHLWIREMKKRKKEKHVPLEQTSPDGVRPFRRGMRSGSSYEYQIPNGPDLEEMYIQKEQCALFYKTLDTLDEATREVMLLRLSGEFSFREIGEIMGRNENWARVTFYRGKQKIRKELKDEM